MIAVAPRSSCARARRNLNGNGVAPAAPTGQNSTTIFGRTDRMRALLLTSIFIAFALVLLHQTNHAHAGEPTRCGFWGPMEAGMSCR